MDLIRCICGDPRGVHHHYRAGTDCSQCPCPWYRPRWLWFWVKPVDNRPA